MKLDYTRYIELVVQHKDATLNEFPSRFCVIRISLDKLTDLSFPPFSLGQVRKLLSIGFYNCPFEYIFVGHRNFDKIILKEKDLDNFKLSNLALVARDKFIDYLS